MFNRSSVNTAFLFALCAGFSSAGCVVATGESASNADDNVAETQSPLHCGGTVSQSDRIDSGRLVESTLSYDPTAGVATVSTSLKNSRSVTGFTAGVEVVFVDASSNPIYASDLQQIGIDACWLSCPRHRTVSWSVNVPANVKDRVAGVAILQWHAPTNRGLLKSVGYLEKVARVCSHLPEVDEVCEAVELGLEFVDPLVKDLRDGAMSAALRAELDKIASHVQLFDNCSSAAPAPNPLLWLRADQGVVTNAASVSAWQDQSGHGNAASMTTSARQPTLVQNAVNALPVVHFDGQQSLYLNDPISPTAFSIFVVGKNEQTSDFSMILGPGGNSPNNQLRWEDGTSILLVGTGNQFPTTVVQIGNTYVFHLMSLIYDGTTLDVYRDANPVSSQAVTSNGPFTFAQVGGWFSTYFMTGDLGELLVYDSALAQSAVDSTNSYLVTRYGLP